KAVTDFRDLAEIYKAATLRRERKRLKAEFNKFLDRPSMTIGEISVPGASFAKEAKEVSRSARRLSAQLEALEVEAIASDSDLIRILKHLESVIHDKLEAGLLLGVKDAPTDANSH